MKKCSKCGERKAVYFGLCKECLADAKDDARENIKVLKELSVQAVSESQDERQKAVTRGTDAWRTLKFLENTGITFGKMDIYNLYNQFAFLYGLPPEKKPVNVNRGAAAIISSLIIICLSYLLYQAWNNTNQLMLENMVLSNQVDELTAKVQELQSSEGSDNTATITLDEYNQIETGMSYNKAKRIIGGEGEVFSEVDLGYGKTTIYVWYGDDGISNANVTVQDGKIIAKAQLALE